ncbi:MAG: ATP-dependent helicase HrpB, partial [Planctomycetes bacterium]|nr:ATP-dependent helicase HrpB [Planctomycetota bacterium]
QHKIRAGREGLEGEKWPDISDKALAADLDWLSPYCNEMTGFSDLKQLNLKKILQGLLPWELRQQLKQDLPTHITVPSGSKKRLTYHVNNTAVLAVRLQEMFGCFTAPTVGNGAVKIMFHLLSPANRPIQVTSDLASFWSATYPQVKKELAGRYPKHYWPDDPNQAQPTFRTQKPKALKEKGKSGRSSAKKR